MSAIVYNACYGGFGLSDDAIRRYAEIKGLTLYPETDSRFGSKTWWTVPPEARIGKVLADDAFMSAPEADRIASNAFHKASAIYDHDIARDDPALVQVVEEMGQAAGGQFAKLELCDLPPGTRYRITEYDGFETVETPDDIDWSIAP